ncbi:MAG: T9SS type A sorting domain-containing protein, partial [Flavobacterium sp.]|nr:T9SS type A sorting domain-containing protein [Flavobacterium sp.]
TVLCYQTATWNPISCEYDVTGTQPQAPTVLCYQTATWNPISCEYDVTGTQPQAPTVLCYQTATWNPISCEYDVTGTQGEGPIVSFVDNCNGTWTVTASGYTGNLSWNTGETTQSIIVTVAGTYSVRQLINGCESQPTIITVEKTCLVGDIYHTGTTCSDFNQGGNDRELDALCYSASNGRIKVVTPGVFFYFTTIVAPSTNFSIKVTQTKGNSTSTNQYGLMAVHGTNQITLWDPNCSKFTDAGVLSGQNNSQGSLTITNAVPGATYVLSVKYNPKSIQGNTYSGSVAPTVTYDFSTSVDNLNDAIANNYTLVANSETSVDLVPGCSVDAVANATTTSARMASSFTVYPVPFKNELNVKYNFENNSEVTIEVFDVRGVLLQTTTDPNGYYAKEVKVDASFSRASNQVYFIRITTNQGTETKKIVSVKE